MNNKFCFLLIVKLVTSVEIDFPSTNTTSEHSFHEVSEIVLCRGCGNDITFSSSIIEKISRSSHYSFYDSVFNQDEVLIQVVMSDFFLPYPLITTSHSNCLGISEWEVADSWYPGYRWKPCVCPDCGSLVGWIFEPINPNFVDKPETFFGLILPNLVGESCKYILFCCKLLGNFSCNSISLRNMASALSPEDKEYLEQCEELFKDRYTEKDAEFMKVHDAEPLKPPIMENWWVSQHSGRRHDRRFNRRSHPYERQNDRRSDYDHDRSHGHRNRRY